MFIISGDMHFHAKNITGSVNTVLYTAQKSTPRIIVTTGRYKRYGERLPTIYCLYHRAGGQIKNPSNTKEIALEEPIRENLEVKKLITMPL